MSQLPFVEGKEIYLKGFPLCPGIAIAKPFLFTVIDENVQEFSVSAEEIDQEVDRYYNALKNSRKDLLSLQKRLKQEGGSEAAAILGSHIEMIHDPVMTKQIEKEIRTKGKNTEYVFKTVIGQYEEKFQKITDIFFQERLKDFQDISRRIIGHLRKGEKCSLAALTSSSVVFAQELSPSDTAEANSDHIEAFVTRSGAEMSHVAIMARAKGIPFVSTVEFPDLSLTAPPIVIVDGCAGDVILNPTKKTLAKYRAKQKRLAEQKTISSEKNKDLETKTRDGIKIQLSVNIEMDGELDTLAEHGGENIGLFRSEYIFLARNSFPSEEEQFAVYRNVVEKIKGNTAVIRTFDIGGDKSGSCYPSRFEKNPYLGCRAIRCMLKDRELFKTQLRAILRASAFGKLRILFPMISGLTELREAKAVVKEAEDELLRQKIPFDRGIAIGCMIEVPSAAITCDLLAEECAFFSIGTNDLVQYAIAVDRNNAAMSYLYTPCHPAVLRLIKMVVRAARKAKKPVSLCGEIAGDPTFTALLLGLGVDELSVSLPSFHPVKNAIRSLSTSDAKKVAKKALQLSTPEEVKQLLSKSSLSY